MSRPQVWICFCVGVTPGPLTWLRWPGKQCSLNFSDLSEKFTYYLLISTFRMNREPISTTKNHSISPSSGLSTNTLLWGKLFTSLSNLDISWLFYIFGNKTAFIFTNIPTNTSSWCYDDLSKDFCKEHLFDDDTSSLSAHLVVAFFTRRKNSSWREDGKTDLHLSLHLLYHQDWVQKSFCTRAKILIWN